MLRLMLLLLLSFLIALQGCSTVPSAPAHPPSAEGPAPPPPLAETPSTLNAADDYTDSSGTAEDIEHSVAEAVPSEKEPSPQTGHPGAVTLPTSYIVSGGETLWTIAARPEIYNDPLLWLLLYQANRDQIMDPRNVYRGQTLRIPRNISEKERNEVREAAQKSPVFPVGAPSPTNR